MPVKSELPDRIIVDRPIHDTFLEACTKYGHEVAMIDGLTKQKYTFHDVSRMTRAAALALHRKGIRQGDVLCLSLPNCVQYFPVLLGGNIIDELSHYLKDNGSKMVFTFAAQLDDFVHLSETEFPDQIKEIVVVGPYDVAKYRNRRVRVSSVDDFVRIEPNDDELPKIKIYTKTDVCYMPYSSGTTGLPKGVLVPHYMLQANYAQALNRAFFLFPTKGDSNLAILPFFHIYGYIMSVMCMIDGVTQIVVPKFDPQAFLQFIQDYKIRMLFIVPPMMVFLAKHPLVSKYDLTSVESLFVGAAPVGKELTLEFVKRHPNVKFVVQGYGMTEHGVSHLMPPMAVEKAKHGSVGILVSNYELKIVDPESGSELEGPNQTGEFHVRSDGMMLGYLNNPQKTAETIDKDGWLHTGDIGYYDEDGFYYIVDRLKELIKVKGFQVAPAELEDLLLQHEGVQDAAVIGVPDDYAGETPLAFVVKKPGSTIDAAAIMDFVSANVAHFKRLSGVRFVSEIPKSPSGKILRRILRDQLANAKAKM